jgi:hypothetical protein
MTQKFRWVQRKRDHDLNQRSLPQETIRSPGIEPLTRAADTASFELRPDGLEFGGGEAKESQLKCDSLLGFTLIELFSEVFDPHGRLIQCLGRSLCGAGPLARPFGAAGFKFIDPCFQGGNGPL